MNTKKPKKTDVHVENENTVMSTTKFVPTNYVRYLPLEIEKIKIKRLNIISIFYFTNLADVGQHNRGRNVRFGARLSRCRLSPGGGQRDFFFDVRSLVQVCFINHRTPPSYPVTALVAVTIKNRFRNPNTRKVSESAVPVACVEFSV